MQGSNSPHPFPFSRTRVATRSTSLPESACPRHSPAENSSVGRNSGPPPSRGGAGGDTDVPGSVCSTRAVPSTLRTRRNTNTRHPPEGRLGYRPPYSSDSTWPSPCCSHHAASRSPFENECPRARGLRRNELSAWTTLLDRSRCNATAAHAKKKTTAFQERTRVLVDRKRWPTRAGHANDTEAVHSVPPRKEVPFPHRGSRTRSTRGGDWGLVIEPGRDSASGESRMSLRGVAPAAVHQAQAPRTMEAGPRVPGGAMPVPCP